MDATPTPCPGASTLRSGLAAAAVALLLSACATQRDQPTTPVVQYESLQALAAGQLRLQCGVACYATWAGVRKKAAGLHRNQLWADLGDEVSRVGYASDVGYFYLARAAEGLGSPAAAATYYRLALATETQCKGWVSLLDSCDGVDVPAQAKAGLARVATGQ